MFFLHIQILLLVQKNFRYFRYNVQKMELDENYILIQIRVYFNHLFHFFTK